MLPGKKGEKRENIYTRKGGSLTVIVCREGVVQTAQGESRKEKCEKVGMGGTSPSRPKGDGVG